MSIKHALMGLLVAGPQHGYELKASLENELVPLSPLNFGQVYSTLDRLERDGLVTHQLVSQEERPDKKVFSLTANGRRELRDWLGSASALSLDLRNETFLKLILARSLQGQVGVPSPAGVVRVERKASFERLHEVAQARFRAQEQGASPEVVLLLDLASFRLEAFVKWLDRCEEVLR